MTEFFVGDVVKVEMPRGYSNRGVLGVSLLYSTMPEARFDGALGTVAEIDPTGPYSVHQYLVDFRSHDNSRAGLPWQAQWFREEWLGISERARAAAAKASDAEPAGQTPASTADIDPGAATAGGFSSGEDSELATADADASGGRATPAPQDDAPTFTREQGYRDDPAVAQPTRYGDEGGTGAADATGAVDLSDPTSAPTSELSPTDHSAVTAELTPPPSTEVTDDGAVSGASPTAPSSPIGESEPAMATAELLAATDAPQDEDVLEAILTDDDVAELRAATRGASLLDPSRVPDLDGDS